MYRLRLTGVFRKWLDGLSDDAAVARIRLALRRAEAGNFGDTKPVGEGVFEMRLAYGPGYRLYYCRTGDITYLLLCGGDKSSQSRDIERAKSLARQLKERT
jgi:putative addiction module killer protein